MAAPVAISRNFYGYSGVVLDSGAANYFRGRRGSVLAQGYSSDFESQVDFEPIGVLGSAGVQGFMPSVVSSDSYVAQGSTGSVGVSSASGSVATSTIEVGALSQDAETPEQLTLYLPVTGTVSQSAVASVEYKLSGSGIWLDAQPLWRIQPQYSSEVVSDAFAGVVFGLTPGSSYDVRVTVSESGKTENVQSLSMDTRPLPRAAGSTTTSVSTQAALVSALGSASPGDVIEITSSFTATGRFDLVGVNGTAANPIFVRGADRDSTVVTYASNSAWIRPDNSSHIVFENFTYTGLSADGGGSSALLQPKDGSGIPDSITVRNMRIQGVDHVVYGENGSDCHNFLIYDNICEGNNQYIPGGWGPDSTAQQTWDDDGVKIGGYGHCVFNNTFSWFGDTIAFNHSPNVGLAQDSKANFAYRNHITYSGDDVFELEYSYRNTAVYDNYTRNCATGVSIDGIWGGPVYVFRNRWINVRRYQIKNGDQATGALIYNNTWVMTEGNSSEDQRRGWYWSQTANINAWEYRNNLVLWEGTSDIKRFDEGLSGFTPWVCTHNGWGRNGTDIRYAASGLTSGTVAQVNAGMSPLHDNDIEITNQAAVFDTPVVFGSNWETPITTDYTLELKSGAEGIGAGVNLPNISNGNDLGAYPQGYTLPDVGNTYTNPTNELATAAAAVSSGSVVNFSAGAMPSSMSFPTDDAGGGSNSMMQWGVRWGYGSRYGALISKRNSSNAYTYVFTYDEASNTWSYDFQGFLGDSGHSYDGVAVDPDGTDTFWLRYGSDSVYEFTGSGFTTRAVNIDAVDNGSGFVAPGHAYHPNLFGTGEDGLVWAGRTAAVGVKLSDNTATQLATFSDQGYSNIAVYCPGRQETYISGGFVSGLYRVTGGTTPTVAFVGNTPVNCAADNTSAGLYALGSNLYVVTDSVYYVSTNGGASWSGASAHGLNTSGAAYPSEWRLAAIEEHGVFWMIAHSGISQLWRP